MIMRCVLQLGVGYSRVPCVVNGCWECEVGPSVKGPIKGTTSPATTDQWIRSKGGAGGGCMGGGLYSSRLRVSESRARPMTFRPLSTNMTWPVIAEARGDARKAATLPISPADSSFCTGEFWYE